QKSAHQQKYQNNPSKSHSLSTWKTFLYSDTAGAQRGSKEVRFKSSRFQKQPGPKNGADGAVLARFPTLF
ncbi:MAG: hypothetical protein ABSF53_23975, partial [Terracidiphilus sp.]